MHLQKNFFYKEPNFFFFNNKQPDFEYHVGFHN